MPYNAFDLIARKNPQIKVESNYLETVSADIEGFVQYIHAAHDMVAADDYEGDDIVAVMRIFNLTQQMSDAFTQWKTDKSVQSLHRVINTLKQTAEATRQAYIADTNDEGALSSVEGMAGNENKFENFAKIYDRWFPSEAEKANERREFHEALEQASHLENQLTTIYNAPRPENQVKKTLIAEINRKDNPQPQKITLLNVLIETMIHDTPTLVAGKTNVKCLQSLASTRNISEFRGELRSLGITEPTFLDGLDDGDFSSLAQVAREAYFARVVGSSSPIRGYPAKSHPTLLSAFAQSRKQKEIVANPADYFSDLLPCPGADKVSKDRLKKALDLDLPEKEADVLVAAIIAEGQNVQRLATIHNPSLASKLSELQVRVTEEQVAEINSEIAARASSTPTSKYSSPETYRFLIDEVARITGISDEQKNQLLDAPVRKAFVFQDMYNKTINKSTIDTPNHNKLKNILLSLDKAKAPEYDPTNPELNWDTQFYADIGRAKNLNEFLKMDLRRLGLTTNGLENFKKQMTSDFFYALKEEVAAKKRAEDLQKPGPVREKALNEIRSRLQPITRDLVQSDLVIRQNKSFEKQAEKYDQAYIHAYTEEEMRSYVQAQKIYQQLLEENGAWQKTLEEDLKKLADYRLELDRLVDKNDAQVRKLIAEIDEEAKVLRGQLEALKGFARVLEPIIEQIEGSKEIKDAVYCPRGYTVSDTAGKKPFERKSIDEAQEGKQATAIVDSHSLREDTQMPVGQVRTFKQEAPDPKTGKQPSFTQRRELVDSKPVGIFKMTSFPSGEAERAEYSMNMALQILNSIEPPKNRKEKRPSKNYPIRISGSNPEELAYLYSALFLLGRDAPDEALRFGRDAIVVDSTHFDPERDLDKHWLGIPDNWRFFPIGRRFTWFDFKFNAQSDSIMERVFNASANKHILQGALKTREELHAQKYPHGSLEAHHRGQKGLEVRAANALVGEHSDVRHFKEIKGSLQAEKADAKKALSEGSKSFTEQEEIARVEGESKQTPGK